MICVSMKYLQLTILKSKLKKYFLLVSNCHYKIVDKKIYKLIFINIQIIVIFYHKICIQENLDSHNLHYTNIVPFILLLFGMLTFLYSARLKTFQMI